MMQVQERITKPLSNTLDPVESLETHGLYRIGLAYGRLVYRFRWLVIALWIVAVIVSIPFASKITSVLQGGGYTYNQGESTHVDAILTSKLHQSPSQVMVVFQSAATPVNDPSYQKEVNNFISRARSFQGVTNVAQGGTRKDGRTTLVIVNFDQNPAVVQQHMANFHTLLPSSTSEGPAIAYLTGNPAANNDLIQITQSDAEHAEMAAMPIALLVLLIVFGSLIAATLPLLLAIVAIPVALAVIYYIALQASMSIFVLTIASIVGIDISIDYRLLITRRFRDELAAGRSVRGAVVWTVATAGEAILSSGLIVMIGFMGLLLIGAQLMTSLGIGGAVVVGTSVIAALTLLPALLGVLGHRVNSLRVPFLHRFTARTQHNEPS